MLGKGNNKTFGISIALDFNRDRKIGVEGNI